MPAFSFEKIPAPPPIESTGAPITSQKNRGRLARLVDRLAEMRLRSYDVESRRGLTNGTVKAHKTKPL